MKHHHFYGNLALAHLYETSPFLWKLALGFHPYETSLVLWKLALGIHPYETSPFLWKLASSRGSSL